MEVLRPAEAGGTKSSCADVKHSATIAWHYMEVLRPAEAQKGLEQTPQPKGLNGAELTPLRQTENKIHLP